MSAVSAPRRRLSIPRLMIMLVVVGGLVAAGLFAVRWVGDEASAQGSPEPWFAGYADVTAVPAFAFESPVSDSGKNVMLSFIVASPDEPCEPTWGAAYSLDQAATVLDLDRRVARLEQQGGDIAISFGGQANDELATACTDPAALLRAYRTVIDRYDISTIDLDIEGDDLDDEAAIERRATAIATLQKSARAAGEKLAVWLTLPVAPTGLDERGQAVVQAMLAADVDLAGVNAMTMNYGASLPEGTGVLEGSQDALTALHRQLGVMYRLAGITLSDRTLWGKIGATPMIGQNDVWEEVFTLDDARALNEFVLDRGIGRVSMWSLNRDTTCGSNYVTIKVVSVACSGVDQGDLRFADLLGADLDGSPEFSAGAVTTDEPIDAAELVDDPATSPYRIWDEDTAYLQGTKVVWHRNVYEAKWWNRGEIPDDPVLNDWETPWLLIGPVLPGETPIPQPTLPPGTYPEWSGTVVFDKGDRVLFEGVPYEAKWWNQGESPEASSSDPDSSAWVPLTVAQIEQVIRSTDGNSGDDD